ncbi:hypothetical protein [Deinococcus sp. JMULE3]|uniref:hypothetical protein n=1 Tax=Deinococcus sp. JMULE3 TaxID=2518341 RepID=UPI0015767A5C|nr:hypothetical protein [Deinococcus sp. JMULE3]NTY02480.1 hypothetical protein [Deinococcus sp. JMULE3]
MNDSLRATALRGLPVWQGAEQIGTLGGLVYDHAARRVRGFTVLSGERTLNVWWADTDGLTRQALHVRAGIPLSHLWHGLGSVARRPVDTLTVRLPDGAGTLFVLDAFLDPMTERIVAYEVGALPRAAARRPGMRIPASDLAWTGQEFQPLGSAIPVLRAVQATLDASVMLRAP